MYFYFKYATLIEKRIPMIINKIDDPLLAVCLLNDEKVIILPTDTVYGLCASAVSENAVDKLFEIKQRDKNRPLQLLVKNERKYLEKITLNLELKTLIETVPTGKVTWIFPNTEELSAGLCSYFKNLPTIGVRTPAHPLWKDIFKEYDSPVAATSANISDQPVLDESSIMRVFGNTVSLIYLENRLYSAESSAVIQITSPATVRILRKSAVLSEKIYRLLSPFIK